MQLNSYLHFGGQCEEAFKFYEKVFGGKMGDIFRYENAPDGQPIPADWRKKIMHVSMTIGDQLLMGMDAPPDRFSKPQGFHINIAMKKASDGKKVFDELSEGGKIVMPFAATFWAPGFGMMVDRYGIPWMVNCEQAE